MSSGPPTGPPAGVRNPYGYVPSKAAAASFIALYGLSTAIHLYQTLFGKRRVWWTIVFTVGGLMEVIGWIGRLLSSSDPTKTNAFLIQIISLIIAPAWLSAGCYAITGAFIRRIGKKGTIWGARTYNIVFIICDAISIMAQAAGGSIAGKESNQGRSPEKGRAILLAGVTFQLASMCIFLALSIRFYKQRWSDLNHLRRRMIWATIFASLCIIVRGIFRTAELGEGWRGYLFTHEVFQIVLDGFPILLCMLTFNLVHPGYTIDVGKDVAPREDAITADRKI
ncbi:RTA1-domain-containing protein [Serendipita vermifera]|nr:RTA1-domain-containing protein [Serendipita vermifera]